MALAPPSISAADDLLATFFQDRLWRVAVLAATPMMLSAGPLRADVHAVAASVCDAASGSANVPTRSFGIGNPASTKLLISCPVPQDSAKAYYYKVVGWTSPGATIYCQLRHIRKDDGSLLHQFSFTLTGTTPVSMTVPGHAQGHGSFGELLCELPAKSKGWLTAIDSYSAG